MKHSFTYYLVMMALKFKGIKEIFSSEVIDYNRLRQQDADAPSNHFYKSYSTSFEILGTKVNAVTQNDSNTRLCLFIHGGAFVSGPSSHHWDVVAYLASKTNVTYWMCNYPKAPEHQIEEILTSIKAVYNKALERYLPENITILGDSAGGTLALALIQSLVEQRGSTPNKLILITPLVDSTYENIKIAEVEKKDKMLSVSGAKSAKQMAAGNLPLSHPMLSPVRGSFNSFPETIVFMATDDICYPDQLLMMEQLKKANVKHRSITGEGMPHIWVYLPILKEGVQARKQLLAYF